MSPPDFREPRQFFDFPRRRNRLGFALRPRPKSIATRTRAGDHVPMLPAVAPLGTERPLTPRVRLTHPLGPPGIAAEVARRKLGRLRWPSLPQDQFHPSDRVVALDPLAPHREVLAHRRLHRADEGRRVFFEGTPSRP